MKRMKEIGTITNDGIIMTDPEEVKQALIDGGRALYVLFQFESEAELKREQAVKPKQNNGQSKGE